MSYLNNTLINTCTIKVKNISTRVGEIGFSKFQIAYHKENGGKNIRCISKMKYFINVINPINLSTMF